MRKKIVCVRNQKSDGMRSSLFYNFSVKDIEIVFISDNDFKVYNLKDLERDLDLIQNELETCTHYYPNSFPSVIIGKFLNLEPMYELEKSYPFHELDLMGAVLYLLSNNNQKDIVLDKDIINLIMENIRISAWYSPDSITAIFIFLNSLYYTRTDFDTLYNLIITKHVIQYVGDPRLIKTVEYPWDDAVRRLCDNKILLKKFITCLLKDSNNKSSLDSTFSFLYRFCQHERIIKIDTSYHTSFKYYFTFDVLKDDEELFKLLKNKLNKLCKYINKTTSLVGIDTILWLGDYFDWSLLNTPLVKNKLNPKLHSYFPNLFTKRKESKYKNYIKSFGFPYCKVSQNEAFLDFCDKEEFKEIVEEIAENVLTYYSNKRPGYDNYYFDCMLDYDNAILLMNTLIPLVANSKNEKFFREFKEMFSKDIFVKNLDFGIHKDFKKKYLKAALSSK